MIFSSSLSAAARKVGSSKETWLQQLESDRLECRTEVHDPWQWTPIIGFVTISSWFANDLFMVSPCFPHGVLMLSEYFPNAFLMISSNFLMISCWFPFYFFVRSSWFRHDFVLISSRFPHGFLMLPSWFPNVSSLFFTITFVFLMISLRFPNDFVGFSYEFLMIC